MSLKNHFLRVLRGYETKRIQFSFTGEGGATIAIGPRNFSLVATAIDAGTLTVAEEVIDKDGATGFYDSSKKHIKIAPNLNKSSRRFDALLVHESVHASLDLQGIKVTTLDGESAGYIAQGYYLHNSGFRRTRELEQLERYGQNSVPGRDGKVDDYWVKAIRETVSANKVYQ